MRRSFTVGLFSAGAAAALLSVLVQEPVRAVWSPCESLVPCQVAGTDCAPLPSSITVMVPGGALNSSGYASDGGSCGSEPAPFPWGEAGIRQPCGPAPVAASCPM
jgi:hypothetical protein